LNFSEFSQKKLGDVIPNRSTRILLYCDTNLQDRNASAATPARTALTLPTFIQLVTYGYPNVYVLGETVQGLSPLLASR